MLVSDLIRALERLAPAALAEPWDNVGLLLGDAARPLETPVMLAIDLSDAVLHEAIEAGATVIVAYHPPIFRPLARLTSATAAGRRLLACAARNMALYSPHTALDAAPGGLADWLAGVVAGGRRFEQRVLAGATADESPASQFKVVVFVPQEPAATLERVRAAMANAGAGRIGAYEQCSFATDGTGSFLGGAGTAPAVGTAGQLEFVREHRLEMVCGPRELAAVVNAARASHPYEEPALEVYPLAAAPGGAGPGRLVTLAEPASEAELVRRLRHGLKIEAIDVAERRDRSPHAVVALVPGSGGELLHAAIDAGATCFVTGEMKHHEVLAALDRGCSVLLAGHTQTERPYLPVFASRLEAALPGLRVLVSTEDRPPAGRAG